MRTPTGPAVLIGLVVTGAVVFGGIRVIDRWTPSDARPAPVSTDAAPATERNRPAPSHVLSDAQLDQVAAVVAATLRGDPSPVEGSEDANATPAFGPAYVVLRQGGLAVGAAWADGDSVLGAVRNATEAARRELEAGRSPDAAEVALSHSFERIDLSGDLPAELSNAHRGVWGLELVHGDETILTSPTRMLATNRDFGRALDVALEQTEMSLPDVVRGGRARRFEAEQALVRLGDPPTGHRMERGNTYVPIEAVTREAVETLVAGMSGWLQRAVHDDGRMTYKYWPSRGVESSANNMIRQWMATTALGRVAALNDSDELWSLSRRNVAYNLEQFYEERDGLGLIIEDGFKVKLGAVALAGRALVEHRDRPDYAEVEAALARMVDHLWREDGSFKTWYLPTDRAGQENFYPGEALYFWSAVYAESHDPELLERFMQSFRYYRDWHLEPANRNPAFVPWHTQAYYEVWRQTRDPELAAFVLFMNDWLLDVQQWDDALYRDTKGRFYDPDRPHFGPPHASATGVYLEGLVDAYRLARELEDHDRAEAYRTAIVRGLRSVMQLQFADDIDLFYISQRDRARGGIRTEVYDNEIRVDNVQHNLMAALKVLETFAADDFRP